MPRSSTARRPSSGWSALRRQVPQSRTAEMSVIGFLMLDPGVLADVQNHIESPRTSTTSAPPPSTA